MQPTLPLHDYMKSPSRATLVHLQDFTPSYAIKNVFVHSSPGSAPTSRESSAPALCQIIHPEECVWALESIIDAPHCCTSPTAPQPQAPKGAASASARPDPLPQASRRAAATGRNPTASSNTLSGLGQGVDGLGALKRGFLRSPEGEQRQFSIKGRTG